MPAKNFHAGASRRGHPASHGDKVERGGRAIVTRVPTRGLTARKLRRSIRKLMGKMERKIVLLAINNKGSDRVRAALTHTWAREHGVDVVACALKRLTAEEEAQLEGVYEYLSMDFKVSYVRRIVVR
jgi:hypothetical protein